MGITNSFVFSGFAWARKPMKKTHYIIIIAWLLLAGVGAVTILLFNNPAECKWLPKCIFYELTGIYCPGCGNTRALYAALHGDILRSLRCNILLFPSGFTVLFLLWKPKMLLKPWVPIAIVSILFIFTILRNLPWYPFTLLAPLP